MRKRMKRLLARILILTLLFPVLSGGGEFETEKIVAATDEKSGLEIVNETQVRARVLELVNKLGISVSSLSQDGNGVYFTYDGTNCTVGSHAECDNCWNGNVIRAQWFIDKFGTISSVNLFPRHYSAYSGGGTISYSAWTCAGFAAFALWYIAKEDNTSSVNREYLGDTQIQSFTIENLKASGIRVGDVIRINKAGTDQSPHSMMFLSMNESAGTIKVLDCNIKLDGDNTSSRVRIHDYVVSDYYNMAITRASNYEPDYNLSLPDAMTSSSSIEAKTNIINYATSLEGWTSSKFTSAGRSDIPSGDWCTWFLKLCGERVGIGSLFSSSTSVSSFCTDMIKNYNAKAYYYSDSTFITSADKTALSGATAVTKSSFTPQPGDIYILHESGFDSMSQVGFVTDVVDGSIYAVVGNNGTAQEVQIRASTSNYFYQITNANCPIIGYIRPNYASLDEVALKGISLSATSATLNVGDTKTLTVTYNPSNTTDNKTVTWKSSNSSVATVSNGKITAKGPGTATITATCGSKSATCTVTVKQPLSGISLDATTVTLNVGGTQTLTVTYNPSNTTDSKTVTWKTSDSAVATVSNGKITAKGPGTATITATCGSKSATCTVTVKQPLNSISLSDTTLTMNVGTNETLTVTYNPSNTTDSKTITWKSSNTKVATVSNGKVVAVAPGTTTITATCGNKSATCTVTVKQPLTGISLSSSKLTLNVGENNTLTVIYNESNTTDSKTVTWTTSNAKVVTVSNGKVVAVAPGTATITATCGNNSATCEVTVKQPLSSITLDKTSITMDIGDSSTLNVTYSPSNTTDNKTVTWSSSNESVAVVSNGKVTAVGAGTATITAVCGSKKATCTIKVNEPKIEVSINETSIDLEIGSSKTIEITYDSGSLPENKTLRFRSSNPSVATVSETGVVTAISSGTVTIIVETNDGEQLAACEVTVPEDASGDTQLPDTEAPDTNEPDTSEPDTNELDTGELDTNQPNTTVPDTDVVDTPSPNNDVNIILVVIAAICAIGMIGMFGIVIVMMKKRK